MRRPRPAAQDVAPIPASMTGDHGPLPHHAQIYGGDIYAAFLLELWIKKQVVRKDSMN